MNKEYKPQYSIPGLIFLLFISISGYTQTKEYTCLPCGYDCDTERFSKPGKCSHCGMQLVDFTTIKFKTIQPSEICNYIQSHPDVVLLDVRTKEEFEGKSQPDYGTFKNALNVPIQELEQRLSALYHLKQREIIVYCSHSHRSPRAAYLLNKNGFNNVTNMAGGLSALKDKVCLKK